MSTIAHIIFSFALAAGLVFGLGYLAACAGAERWLTPFEWWGSWQRSPPPADSQQERP